MKNAIVTKTSEIIELTYKIINFCRKTEIFYKKLSAINKMATLYLYAL